MASPLLEVKDISKTFGELLALSDVDLRIDSAQFHGLIGPNGSGKSTLMKCIAGAERPDTGSIRFLERDITHDAVESRVRSGLSLKFQITSVFPSLSVYDNILMALQADQPLWRLVLSRSRRTLHDRVMAALEQFRLDGRAAEIAGVLSHGEQQWLEIAMALAPGPRLLLLDEPTAGMSMEERRITGELLTEVKDRCGMVIVEHDLDFIKEICDVLTVLDQGRILDSGTVAHIESSEKVQEVYLRRE